MQAGISGPWPAGRPTQARNTRWDASSTPRSWSFLAALLGCGPFIPWVNDQWSRLAAAFPGRAVSLEAVRSATRVVLLAAVFLLSVMKLASGTYNPFIYFRF